MAFYSGTVVAVPTANKAAYLDHAKAHWPLFQRYGALSMVESWGVDVPRGKVNDFYGAVAAQEGESIAFFWIEWPDQQTADAAWVKMRSDPEMAQLPAMPFDGKRMIYGGFSPVFASGGVSGAAYVQGFLLAVPSANAERYRSMAAQALEDAFRPHGAVGIMEGWGADVPHGTETDFYRATLAKEGEVPVFSWVTWPDRASCDAAAAAMQAAPMPEKFELPFDGMRMIWGGFEVIFDSGRG